MTLKIVYAVILVLFILLTVVPVFVGIQSHCFNAFDLGIYSRALAAISWNDLNPWISVRGVRIFFDHFDPILIIPAMFSSIVSPSLIMATLEWVSVTGAAYAFVYAYEQKLLPKEWTIFAIIATFFGHGMAIALHYPGHPSTWSLMLLSWSCCFMRKDQVGRGLLLMLLAMAFKEEYAVYALVLSVLAAWYSRKSRQVAILSAIIAVSACVLLFVVRPRMADVYVGYEKSLTNGLSQTQQILAFYSDSSHWRELMMIFMPCFFLPFLGRRWPWERKALLYLLMVMLGVRAVGLWWFPHRSAQVFLVALWTFLPNWDRVTMAQKLSRWVPMLAWLSLAVSMAPTLKYARATIGQSYKKSCPLDAGRLNSIEKGVNYLLEAPEGLAVVQGNLVPALARRDQVILWDHSYDEKAKYILVEKQPFGDPWPLSEEEQVKAVDGLLGKPGWGVVMNDEYVLLLHKLKVGE